MGDEQGEDTTVAALQNEVILREIFKHLPTSTLLSCSRVNTLWNNEARSFIRDYRECAVRVGFYSDRPLCESLLELEKVLGDMTTIPFNSIYIFVTNHRGCDKEADMTATNLLTRFPLKFLSLMEYGKNSSCGRLQCPAVPLILELIRRKSSMLTELEIRRGGRYLGIDGLFCDWEPPKFEKLKKLSIESGTTMSSECVKQLVHGASNLKEIHGNCLNKISIAAVPDNKFDTLKRLAFDIGDVNQLEKFADKLDHLEELIVDVGFGIYDDDPETLRFVRLLEKLFALNSTTLRNFGIRCENGFIINQLGLPPMPSVQVLCISVHKLSRSLIHIMVLEFPELFPNLRKVNIREDKPTYFEELYGDINVIYYEDAHGNVVPFERDNDDEVPDEDINGNMIPEDIIAVPNASGTTRELVVDANIRDFELLELRKLFPNVLSFSIQGRYNIYFPPLGLVGSLWPNLESLQVKIEAYGDELDEEVFGLNKEELDLFRHQDNEFLKTVQIVPCRPCVGLMRNLKDFVVEFFGTLRRDYTESTTRTSLELIQGLLTGRKTDLSFRRKHVTFVSYWSRSRFQELWEDVYPYDLWDWNAVDDTDEESISSVDSTDLSDSSSSHDDSYESSLSDWSE